MRYTTEIEELLISTSYLLFLITLSVHLSICFPCHVDLANLLFYLTTPRIGPDQVTDCCARRCGTVYASIFDQTSDLPLRSLRFCYIATHFKMSSGQSYFILVFIDAKYRIILFSAYLHRPFPDLHPSPSNNFSSEPGSCS